MNKAKISEIFRSVQGEGKYAGVPQVFVRFFECNMHCVWCDTPHAIGDTVRHYKEFSPGELWRKISELWDHGHSVSLTGGEPLIQKDFIKALLPRLKGAQIVSYLETNGIYYEALGELIDNIDIIAMDIKLPSSTKCRPFWREHKEFLKIAQQKDVFIKAVISSDTDKEDVLKSIALVAEVDSSIVFVLQPNYFDRHNGVMDKCLAFQKECSARLKNVRVLPQIHKYMKLR